MLITAVVMDSSRNAGHAIIVVRSVRETKRTIADTIGCTCVALDYEIWRSIVFVVACVQNNKENDGR